MEPYWTKYSTYANERWIDRKLVDAFRDEFISMNPSYWVVACKMGRIYINDHQMVDPDYVVMAGDKIEHVIHQHEHPILSNSHIDIIENNDELLVIDKPPSIPVFPRGRHHRQSVMEIISTSYGIGNLRVLHGLSRIASGLCVFAKSIIAESKFRKYVEKNECHKEYICITDGVFPDGEIVCNQPIGTLIPSLGIHYISDTGKSVETRFRRLWTDGVVSAVRCVMGAGRTHQIRVHLQYLGFPIKGDRMYNSYVWGPNKGKNADYVKTHEKLCSDIEKEYKFSLWLERIDPGYEKRLEDLVNQEVSVEKDVSLEDRPNFDPICIYCHTMKLVVPDNYFMIYLHCIKFSAGDWIYSTTLPDWAKHPDEV
ncbi:hypothetical protein AB6A40_008052 [Gnathostoma spinigerum]|uniref:Pseudouridine synthase RsuA/RluA-like domain-containing protein n=1 Tax=Gnathostoma spinigerum TaxID=75299 RepID=A0ABD6EWA5_9BILA